MTSKIQAVIFDMDGLMIDSEQQQSASIEALLREHGIEPVIRANGIVHIAGRRVEDNLQRLKDRHNLTPSVEDLHRRKNELYRESLAKGVDVMPGLPELLDDLKPAPVKKALASGSSQEDVRQVLAHMGLEDYFDAVVSGYEVKNGKPEPDIFLEAAKRLGIDPRFAVVLEDAGVGVTAAKAAGMKVIAIPNKYTRDHDFDAADLVVSSLKEVNWEAIQKL